MLPLPIVYLLIIITTMIIISISRGRIATIPVRTKHYRATSYSKLNVLSTGLAIIVIANVYRCVEKVVVYVVTVIKSTQKESVLVVHMIDVNASHFSLLYVFEKHILQ